MSLMMSLSVVHREGGMVRPARPWKVEIFLGSRFMLVSEDGTFCGPQGEWNICLGPMFDFFSVQRHMALARSLSKPESQLHISNSAN